VCHSLEPGKNMLGPSLHGLIGRKAGSVPGDAYSPAMKNVNVIWNDDTLSKYRTQLGSCLELDRSLTT
jgi:cytochrome c2